MSRECAKCKGTAKIVSINQEQVNDNLHFTHIKKWSCRHCSGTGQALVAPYEPLIDPFGSSISLIREILKKKGVDLSKNVIDAAFNSHLSGENFMGIVFNSILELKRNDIQIALVGNYSGYSDTSAYLLAAVNEKEYFNMLISSTRAKGQIDVETGKTIEPLKWWRKFFHNNPDLSPNVVEIDGLKSEILLAMAKYRWIEKLLPPLNCEDLKYFEALAEKNPNRDLFHDRILSYPIMAILNNSGQNEPLLFSQYLRLLNFESSEISLMAAYNMAKLLRSCKQSLKTCESSQKQQLEKLVSEIGAVIEKTNNRLFYDYPEAMFIALDANLTYSSDERFLYSKFSYLAKLLHSRKKPVSYRDACQLRKLRNVCKSQLETCNEGQRKSVEKLVLEIESFFKDILKSKPRYDVKAVALNLDREDPQDAVSMRSVREYLYKPS